MVKYKEKVCLLCGLVYTPTSPKQKYCIACKDGGRRLKDRKRDRIRNRKKYNYVEYTRICKHCGIKFKTHYKKKKYCGAEECEKVRVIIKNKRTHAKRPKEYMIKKGRRYYKENRGKCLQKKATIYRQRNSNARPYISGKSNKLTYEYVKDYIEHRGYKLLSNEYINNREKLLLECPKEHKWETSFHNFMDSRCFYCYIENNYISKFEKSVKEYVNKIYSGSVIYNDRKQIINPNTGCNLELDIWFPDLNKAIECNGVYWHEREEAIIRDKAKQLVCEEQGIGLLVITDKEWPSEIDETNISRFVGVVE